MSYTPDDQLLEQPLRNAVEALEALRAPIFKRLKAGAYEWNESHLEELKKILLATSNLQVVLVEMMDIVR
jgi:hypothetical protein